MVPIIIHCQPRKSHYKTTEPDLKHPQGTLVFMRVKSFSLNYLHASHCPTGCNHLCLRSRERQKQSGGDWGWGWVPLTRWWIRAECQESNLRSFNSNQNSLPLDLPNWVHTFLLFVTNFLIEFVRLFYQKIKY